MNQPTARDVLRPGPIPLLALLVLARGPAGRPRRRRTSRRTRIPTAAPMPPLGQGPRHRPRAHARTAGRPAFHDQMRKLWEDHVTWTRLAIVTLRRRLRRVRRHRRPAAAQPDGHRRRDQAVLRRRGRQQLTALLRDHISIAVEVLQAAKAGDTAAFADARTPRGTATPTTSPTSSPPQTRAPGRRP